MVGMPNSSREHIIQSVKYAKQLDLFLYRWHIFQLPLIEIHNTVDKTVKPEDYFTMQLNVPDNCLDEVLSNINKKSARLIKKVLDSAVANAVNNNGADAATLYVKEARVDAGPVMKRHLFDSRSHIGHKDRRTSHIVITVATK